ncbi:MAG: hypothetical protein J5636_01460 [Clostridiales bacterium]|nr:hypothetical protein [Clostridiales bacterium]
MKKAIASILAMAMLLGCVGCTSKETTKKKPSKTKKPTTEETDAPTEDPTDDPETDPTDDPTGPTGDPGNPTDTIDTTEPSDTDDPTAPYGDPAQVPDPFTLPSGITIHHDLEKLQLGRDVVYRAYGDVNPDSDYGDMSYVTMKFDELYTIEGGPIQDSLSDKFTKVAEDALASYQYDLDKFLQVQQNGSTWPGNSYYNVETVVYRADSEYVSFILNYMDFGPDYYEFVSVGMNYRTSDGGFITIEEVVTDMDALYAYVVETMDPTIYGYEDLIQEVQTGACAFALTYDGIYIAGFGKVPVFGNENMFDLSYFGGVPDTYGLILDYNGEAIWDVTEDAALDSVRVTADIDTEDDGISKLNISVNGDVYRFDRNDIDNLAVFYGISQELPSYLLRTRNGYYLVVTLESWYWCDTCVFKLDGNAVRLVNEDDVIVREGYDPDNLRVSDSARLTGLVSTKEYCFLNEDGSMIGNSIFKEIYAGPYKTLIDLPANETNLLTMEIGDAITLPAGSIVSSIYVVEGAGLLVMRVLDPDDSKTFHVVLETDCDGMIAGCFAGEAFSGLSWGE